MLAALALLLLSALVLAAVVMLLSPGRPRPYVDGHGRLVAGSISEKVFVSIHGVDQGMFIKGSDATRPVLLYLHGGMPDYFLTSRYPTGLDEHFVVVCWEQRGSGLSYRASIPPETVNPEQLIADTLAVTNYLRSRFGRDRIYLMGHSGGTFIGIQAAARAPELYHAYLGVAQMSHQLKSEQLAWDYMLRRGTELGDRAMVPKLGAAPVGAGIPLPRGYTSVRDIAMHRLGIGTTHDMRSIVSGLLWRSLVHREYTVAEKINLWRGKVRVGARLWDAQLSTDLSQRVPRLDIPVYFLHGVYDYTEARRYFDQLAAPVKGFYTFQHSAHSPLFEEPERMCEIVRRDVLRGATELADRP